MRREPERRDEAGRVEAEERPEVRLPDEDDVVHEEERPGRLDRVEEREEVRAERRLDDDLPSGAGEPRSTSSYASR